MTPAKRVAVTDSANGSGTSSRNGYLPNEDALQEIYRIMQRSGIDKLFHADEDRIIDRTAIVTVPCTVCDVGTFFNPKGTVFDTVTGEPSWD